MADDIEFVNGLIVKSPHPNAPDFVKCAISIKVADLAAWLSQRDDEWVNIDVKESKGGKWYCAVSTFKPKSAHQEAKQNGYQPQAKSDEDFPPF